MTLPLRLIASSACILLLAVAAANAQQSLNQEVAISKIEATFLDTPKVQAGGFSKRSSGRPGSWLEVEVTFEHAPNPRLPQTADELTVNYYVLLKNETFTLDRKPTMLSGKVAHIHVPAGKALHSSIYVPPRVLENFFGGKMPVNAAQAITDVGVTITGKDGLLAISTMRGTVKGDKGWWDNADQFTTVAGRLYNKDQTPFASLEWDFYELIKPATTN